MWSYGVHMQSEKTTGLHDLEECFSSARVEQIADADDQRSTSAHVLCRDPSSTSEQDCLATARDLRPRIEQHRNWLQSRQLAFFELVPQGAIV